MATHGGVNPHAAADLLRQAMAQNALRETRDDIHDQIGSEAPTPSGVETPRPDLVDKRLPGIMHSYFGQVGSNPSQNSPLRQEHPVTTPSAHTSGTSRASRPVRDPSQSRRSSTSSGSLVMVDRSVGDNPTPPLQSGEPEQTSEHAEQPCGVRRPPTPTSAGSSFLRKDGEAGEKGKSLVGTGIVSVAQALRNFVLPKPSKPSVGEKSRRPHSLPVSKLSKSSVMASHISNPSSCSHSPTTQSPNISPQSNDKPKVSKSFRELNKLTSNAAAESRDKNTPPMTPRTLSHEGSQSGKRSPISSTSTPVTASSTSADTETGPKSSSKRDTVLPTHSPRGKLVIKINEGRGLKPSYDPYVVCQFEWNEYVSSGARHDAMDIDDEQKKRLGDKLSSIPIRRTDSDMGRPMAIPMRSRQTSSNGLSENEARQLAKVTDPQWDHEATFDVLSRQSEIDISVYDRREDSFLGHVRLCLLLSEQNPVLDEYFRLEPRGPQDEGISGEIHVKMEFSKTDKKQYGPNDFKILRLVGKGTFGQVYQVMKKDTQRIYAMKVLSKKVIIQKKEVAHTIGERNILVRTAMTDSPFIVGLKFSFQTPTDLYLVTDFMSGGELFWHLQKEGRFKEDRAKFYIAELILALKHLHEHDIVYRDLKPENILLDANGHIALCDFGLSKANLSKDSTTSTFCGTTEYLAPEVLLDEQGYTKMVDFWSLGVLVFEMCCGWSPFYAEDTQQMYKNIAFGKVRFPRDALSQEGRNFVKGLLNRNPRHRLGANGDAEELMRHEFFRDIDWKALAKKNVVPPFKPKVTSLADTSNFDPEFTNAMDVSSSLNARAAAIAGGAAPASTPLSPTLQNAFKGFTFVDSSTLEDQYGRWERNGNDEGFDEPLSASISRSKTHDHRMSGVQKTGEGTEGIFNEENWDM